MKSTRRFASVLACFALPLLIAACGAPAPVAAEDSNDQLAGKADRVRGGRTAPNPCATVLCPPGSKCVVEQVDCVRWPCPEPTAACVPVEEPSAPAPTCGGVAAIRCPGYGDCVDDPADGCDPKYGGADCGGVCVCNADYRCRAGFHWDPSPSVCSCVADR
jgi:hypothetical protein